jgi:class 3 adenylate cyclase
MQPGPTRYAKSGHYHLAYSVTGEGPLDVLYVPTWLSQIEHLWASPKVSRFFERSAHLGRLIMFDRRGSGMSDPIIGAPTLEEQMDDVNAVLDAAGGCEDVVLLAALEGGPMACLYAATHPHRVRALILYSAWARVVQSEDIPWANPPEQRERLMEFLSETWGTGARLDELAPSEANDPEFRAWYAKLERLAASPNQIRLLQKLIGEYDVRDVLSSIRVPTLVMHRRDDTLIDPRHSQYIAERIPDAKLVMLEGSDNLMVAGDSDAILDEIEEFLTGTRRERDPDRILATVMFTDIVGSTDRAATIGDLAWRDLLARHHAIVRRELSRYRGHERDTAGDGFFATFDGPARAIGAAQAITGGVRTLGLEARIGIHVGECELHDDKIAGLAVNIGSRVASSAGSGEVLVSQTVRDLVAGSGIRFADRGIHELKGIPGTWQLFAVAGPDD